MPQKPNVIERLIGWIPGYSGYTKRESRRDSDRLLREAAARSLGPAREALDAAIGRCSSAMKFEPLEPLEALRRRLTAITDRLRHAPAGYSGFFDTMKLDQEQLDAIHEHDEALHGLADRIVAAARAIEPDDRATITAVGRALDELEAALRRRDDLLKGAE